MTAPSAQKPHIIVRDATEDDVTAITATLNWAITRTTAIFRKDPATEEERRELHAQLQAQGFPVLVATDADGTYLGWALLKPHQDLRTWDGCFENTIYLDPHAHGQGAGSALMAALIDWARSDERVHTILSRIASGNDVSIALHEKFGFTHSATLRQVSRKFGTWLDLHHLQLMLRD